MIAEILSGLQEYNRDVVTVVHFSVSECIIPELLQAQRVCALQWLLDCRIASTIGASRTRDNSAVALFALSIFSLRRLFSIKLAKFMSRFGKVVDVAIGYNDSDLVNLYCNRGRLKQKVRAAMADS